jgi:hypothetical protein
VKLELVTSRVITGGAEVTLRAIAKDIERDPIVKAAWTAGDGSEAVVFSDLTPFSHFYAGEPGQAVRYVVTVMVEDARGARCDFPKAFPHLAG